MHCITSRIFPTAAAVIALGVFASSPPPSRPAPPQVNYLFPAGGQAGQTVNVTAGGNFPRWPAKVWTSRADVAVAPGQEKGKLAVQIAADAPPGIAWLRLFDEEGAAAVRPFLIGTLPEAIEQEPNDDPLKPHALWAAGLVVNGQLGKTGDVDTFAVPLRKGETLVASLRANTSLGSPMDGVLQIVSPAGFVLAQNDDEHGLDPLIVFPVQTDGTHLVRLFGFPATPNSTVALAGGETFVYRLTITTGGFAEHAWPLAVTRGQANQIELCGWNIPAASRLLTIVPAEGEDLVTLQRDVAGALILPVVRHPSLVEEPQEPNRRQTLPVPSTVTGRISQAGETDVYSINAAAGQKLQIRVDSRSLGLPLDPTLKVLDAAGKAVAAADDSSRDSRDVDLVVTIAAGGEHGIQVRDLHRQGGPRYVYRLTVAPVEPDFALRVAVESFVLPAGKPLEIPVTVERTNGFAGEIEITAVGLPEGVTASAVKSGEKGETAKQVKLSLASASGPHSLPIRIVGAAMGDMPRTRIATFPQPAFGASQNEFWLTVQKP